MGTEFEMSLLSRRENTEFIDYFGHCRYLHMLDLFHLKPDLPAAFEAALVRLAR
jgi:hypothetical protein